WKLNGKILEIEITPNRPDCLGVIGVARELAALCRKPLEKPQVSFKETNKVISDLVKISIEDVDGCPRYSAGFMESVQVKPSPIWMRRRLMNSGIRPINNIVDASNYVMLETGHPVHVFDYSKISDGHIIVRKALKDEQVLLLDERTYSLKGIETLITDNTKILAVGGIMGAADSGVNDKTKDIVLEVAYFNPVRIRRSSKALNIKSDASYRFERGVDPNDAFFVLARLVQIIQQLAGGMAAKGFADLYLKKISPREVTLRKSRLSLIMGTTVDNEKTEEILRSLEMKTERTNEGWKVVVPTFRPDISIEEDLIEEVGRIYGYERINAQMPRIPAIGGGWSNLQTFRKKVREFLIASGLDETMNLSFTSSKLVEQLMKVVPVRLNNPLTEEMDCLRPSLVFGLIDSLAYNMRRQLRDVKFFEIAKVYNLQNGTPAEREKIGIIMSGQLNEDDYTDQRSVSLLNLKGILDELCDHLSIELEVEPVQIDWLVTGRSGMITLHDQPVGIIGMLSKSFNQVYDIKPEIYYMELDLEAIFKSYKSVRQLKVTPNYPAIRRDISLLIPVGFSSKEITDFLNRSSEYVERVGVSDVYRGKDIPEDTTSVTFYAIYRALDRSLTDEEVNSIFEDTVRQIETKFGVRRRFV
ncbi:MAG: phenylalanine--tRNA ligase subunit beta, partial [Pseudothermotoga sp.]